MTKFIKKPLSVLLAALMIVSLFVAVPVTASAEVVTDEYVANIGDTFDSDNTTIWFDMYAVTLKGGTYTHNDQVVTDDITFGDTEQCSGADGAYIKIGGSFVHGEDVYEPVDKNGDPSTWYVIGKSDGDDGKFYLVLGGYDPNEAPTGYTVTFKNYDSTVLQETKGLAKGALISYDGETPEKAEDENYTYTFAGWSPEITAVTGDVTYTATYTETAKAKPWTYNITTGGVYTCPSTLSQNTIVSGGTEDNPVIINITGPTKSDYAIVLRSGYLKIVGNNNTVTIDNTHQSAFVLFSVNGDIDSCKPNGDAHLTVTDLTISSENTANNQYIQIKSSDYKCQSTFENVTFKNRNLTGSGILSINNNATYTFKNCTFEDNTGGATGGISAWSNSEVIMEGCTFKNCKATNTDNNRHGGGAVWVRDNAKLTLDGCTFENCTGKYGAVGIESTASLTLKGNTTITDNANGNLYLSTGATCNVAEDFTGTVGITTQTAPTDSASVTLVSGLADTQAALANKNIVSDNENYGVIYKDNSLLLINSKVYTVTWKNDDGTVLKTEALAEGTTPTYDGADPEKAEDENNTYTFSGWTPEITAVTGDVTYTATYTAKPKKLISGQSITLDGNIGINFYLDPEAAGLTVDQVTEDNLSYTFAWADDGVNAKVNVAEQSGSTFVPDGDKIKVTCKVCAAEMTCGVNATFTLKGKTESKESKTYSVRDYADTILSDGTQPEKLKDLIKAMLNYGAKAQTKFEVNTGKLANDGVAYNPGDVTDAMLDTAIAAANGTDKAANMNEVAAQHGAKWYSTSLIYLDNNTIRHYFVKANDAFDSSDYPASKADYYYYVEVPGIAAAELDNLQTFKVGDESFKYSALDFVKGMINSSADGDSKSLAKALYWYNQAANKYFA